MSILSQTAEYPLRISRADMLAGLVLGGWASLAVVTALSGWAEGDPPSWLLPGLIFGPILLFVTGLVASPALRHWVLSLDQRFLIGVHATRTVGLGFLFLYTYDILPAAFAFPAGIGDAVAAVWAVWLAFSLGRGVPVRPIEVARWNTFGILDFLIAIGIGLALRSQYLGGEINTDPMGSFPLALIPLFAVPLFSITHLILFYQLRISRLAGGRASYPGTPGDGYRDLPE